MLDEFMSVLYKHVMYIWRYDIYVKDRTQHSYKS